MLFQIFLVDKLLLFLLLLGLETVFELLSHLPVLVISREFLLRFCAKKESHGSLETLIVFASSDPRNQMRGVLSCQISLEIPKSNKCPAFWVT